jgi:ubiquinone/menaquinone biosynthesis C-methylase UbiE
MPFSSRTGLCIRAPVRRPDSFAKNGVQAGIDKLPLPDGLVDVVISNGVFNPRPDNPGVPAEAFRVLRPGGCPQMADIRQHNDVTPEEVAHKGEWSDGIAAFL